MKLEVNCTVYTTVLLYFTYQHNYCDHFLQISQSKTYLKIFFNYIVILRALTHFFDSIYGSYFTTNCTIRPTNYLLYSSTEMLQFYFSFEPSFSSISYYAVINRYITHLTWAKHLFHIKLDTAVQHKSYSMV